MKPRPAAPPVTPIIYHPTESFFEKNSLWFSIIAAFLFVGLCFVFARSCEKAKEPISMVAIGQIEAKRAADGTETAKRQSIEANYEQLLASKDAELQQLRDLVQRSGKHTKSATIAAISTSGKVKMPSAVVSDTAKADSSKAPTYTATYSDPWLTADITSGPDSTTLRYQVRNELEITQVEERQGFLKPRRTVIKIRNLSPNTSTTELQSYTVKPKKPRRLIWLLSGAAAGAAATIYTVASLSE